MKAILTYHSVDSSNSVISISEREFRSQVEWLAAHGPRVVTIDELLRAPAAEAAVALTFDDAFVNFGDVAWPILRAYGLPATLYIPTSHVGGTNAWGGIDASGIPTLPLLDWERLGRLAEEGVQLGSHTCTHPHLTRVPHAQLREELEESAARLQSMLGVRPAGLAYPYGAHDDRVVQAAAALYDHAVTVELRPLARGDDRCRLPRLDMYYLRGNQLLASWGSQKLKLYLSARAGARRWRGLLSAGRMA